jgi:hypothetical protein
LTKSTVERDKQRGHEKEVITPDTILRRFKIYNEYISKIRQKNIDNGLDAQRSNLFVPQSELKQQEIYEKFIQKTTHPRTGKWYTVKSLQEAGVISDLEVDQFDSELPYARLNRLTRVKSGNKEWLERMFTLYAITREGNVVHKVIIDSDYYHEPEVTYQYVPANPEDQNGKQIHVGIVRNQEALLEPTGQKVQLLEYSEDKVHQILRDFPPAGEFSDLYNGCSLTLKKVGEAHDLAIVKSLSEFLEPFDMVWNRLRNPNTGAKIDVKELVTELQKQTITAAEQHDQYG